MRAQASGVVGWAGDGLSCFGASAGARERRGGGGGDLERLEHDAGAAAVEEIGGDAVGDLKDGGAEGVAVGDSGHLKRRGGGATAGLALEVVEDLRADR